MITPAKRTVPGWVRTVPLWETTPESLAFLASAYMVVFCNSRFWAVTVHAVHPGPAIELAFFASLPLTLAALYFLLLLLLPHRALKPSLVILFCINAVVLYFIDTYHIYIDRSMLRNALQTDWREARELFDDRMTVYVLLFAVLPSAALRLVRLRTGSMRQVLARKFVLLMTTSLVVAGVVTGLSHQYMFFAREHRDLQFLVVPANYLSAAVSLYRHAHHDPASPETRIPIGPDARPGPSWQIGDKPLLLVLVIGETARAEAFSLNGYSRDTNPELSRYRIFNFPNVHSCATSTAESLPCMFRPFGRNGPDTDDLHRYESLLNVVERAGVGVLWLDNNSGCKGVCAGVEARSVTGTGDAALCDAGNCYDELLLRDLGQVLAGPRQTRVVVLHQQGSHGPAYFRRYPTAFQKFSPDCRNDTLLGCSNGEIRNAYDNTILYTDYVLARLIDKLQAVSNDYDTAMLYVSDHGESLGENGLYLHGLPYLIAPDTQTHVPMVFWMSDAYSVRSRLDGACLAHATFAAYSHDNLFASVLGLLDIETSAYERRQDVFAPCKRDPGVGTADMRPSAVHKDGTDTPRTSVGIGQAAALQAG